MVVEATVIAALSALIAVLLRNADGVEPIAVFAVSFVALYLLWVVAAWSLVLFFVLLGAAFTGAVDLFRQASDQGFIGIAPYIGLWGLLFPIMLVVCVAWGFVLTARSPYGIHGNPQEARVE